MQVPGCPNHGYCRFILVGIKHVYSLLLLQKNAKKKKKNQKKTKKKQKIVTVVGNVTITVGKMMKVREKKMTKW